MQHYNKGTGRGRKSSIYILAENDEFELPLIVGTKQEVARYAECRIEAISECARGGHVLADKYKVYKYTGA